MSSISSEINKVFRQVISPALLDAGFSKTTARRSWKWLEDCVWVLEIRAVGKYFSDVTGWPPMSVGVWTGIYHEFIPSVTGRATKNDDKGRLLPNEVECHSRSHLTCTLNQSTFTKDFYNPAEQKRKDIWWIEHDISNIESVAENICLRFIEQGLPWYQKFTAPENLLIELERTSCYDNWFRAMYLSQNLGLKEKFEEYKSKVDKFELSSNIQS